MTMPLMDVLRDVEVLEPRDSGHLRVFGLRRRQAGSLVYRTLEEGLAAEEVEITEVSEGGSVPTLRVVNRGGLMLFLMDGEQLIGAKQNRVLNTSIMVPATTTLAIPVSCVEAHRWRYRTKKFSSTNTTSHSNLRRRMMKDVNISYRSMGTPTSDQGAVWREVDAKLAKHSCRSSSAALEQVYEDLESPLSKAIEQLSVPEGCCGAVFTHGSQVAGLDIFDQPGTLSKLWTKLIRCYAVDALEPPQGEPISRDAVQAWLQSVADVQVEPYKSPGLGEDLRVEGRGVVGAGLLVEQQPVHVGLFADDTAESKA